MKQEIKTEYKNRLPHIAPIGATFFVTFRLGDSLPQAVIQRLKQQMDSKIEQLKRQQPKGYKEKIRQQHKLFFKQYDHQLDELPFGNCYLKQPEVAKIVADKLHDLDGSKYDLIAYCIMPNHVHLLFDTSIQIVDKDGFYLEEVPENYTQLYQIMKSIKGSTAYLANKLLNRTGTFWQKDSYDHFIRNEKEFWNIIRYILQNPVRANLVEKWEDHKFTYLANKFAGTVHL